MTYVFMQMKPSAAMSGKSVGQQNWGERAFGNLNEQSPMFLVAIWLHALFVSPDNAATLGWVYLALRILYVMIWMFSGRFTMKVLAATMPMYGIIWFLTASTV